MIWVWSSGLLSAQRPLSCLSPRDQAMQPHGQRVDKTAVRAVQPSPFRWEGSFRLYLVPASANTCHLAQEQLDHVV